MVQRIDDVVLGVFPELNNDKDVTHGYGYIDATHPTPSKFRFDYIEPLVFTHISTVLHTLYQLATQDWDRVYSRAINTYAEMPDIAMFTKINVPRQ